jgi:hypothetical protein
MESGGVSLKQNALSELTRTQGLLSQDIQGCAEFVGDPGNRVEEAWGDACYGEVLVEVDRLKHDLERVDSRFSEVVIS